MLFLVQMSLFAVVAAEAGCIVPVELSPQRVVANSRPQIITTEVMPPQGQDVVHTKDDAFPFTIVAEDVDIDDTLSMRLFRTSSDGKSRIRLDDELLTASDTSDPVRRRGSFVAQKWCQVLNLNGSEYVSVRVSDNTFANFQDDQTPGLFDDIFWVLRCQ